MACCHCGERLIVKQAGNLCCCGCGRLRHDLELNRGGPILQRIWPLALALLALPLALGVAATDQLRLDSSPAASAVHTARR